MNKLNWKIWENRLCIVFLGMILVFGFYFIIRTYLNGDYFYSSIGIVGIVAAVCIFNFRLARLNSLVDEKERFIDLIGNI